MAYYAKAIHDIWAISSILALSYLSSNLYSQREHREASEDLAWKRRVAEMAQ
jgi:hypothetical protein